MGGQIVDASLVSAQRQRNTRAEKEAIKAGKTAEEIWPDHPNKAAQKDADARWTVKITKPTDQRAARSASQLAIPVFGHKSHVLIDRRFGFIRTFSVTDAASHEGRLLRDLVSTQNTASDVWALRPIAPRATRHKEKVNDLKEELRTQDDSPKDSHFRNLEGKEHLIIY